MLGGTQSLGWVCLIGICVVWAWHGRGMGVSYDVAMVINMDITCWGERENFDVYLLSRSYSMLSHVCALVPNNHAARHGDELALETSLCKYPKNKSMPRCRLAAYIF